MWHPDYGKWEDGKPGECPDGRLKLGKYFYCPVRGWFWGRNKKPLHSSNDGHPVIYNYKGKTIYQSRLAVYFLYGFWPHPRQIYHKNGDIRDNSKKNIGIKNRETPIETKLDINKKTYYVYRWSCRGEQLSFSSKSWEEVCVKVIEIEGKGVYPLVDKVFLERQERTKRKIKSMLG